MHDFSRLHLPNDHVTIVSSWHNMFIIFTNNYTANICFMFHQYLFINNNNNMKSPLLNTTGATNGVGATYISGSHEFTPGFNGFRVGQSSVLCIWCCRSLFVFLFFFFWPLYFLFWPLYFPIVLSVFLHGLWFMDSAYLFAIFNLVLNNLMETLPVLFFPSMIPTLSEICLMTQSQCTDHPLNRPDMLSCHHG